MHSRVFLVSFSFLLLVALSGCSSPDASSLAMSDPVVQTFVQEHPGYSTSTRLFSRQEVSSIAAEMKADCQMVTVPEKGYTLINITDSQTSEYITAWIDWEANTLICAKRHESNVVCNAHAGYGCYGGNIHWKDSCGKWEDKKEQCSNGCSENACIPNATSNQTANITVNTTSMNCSDLGGYCIKLETIPSASKYHYQINSVSSEVCFFNTSCRVEATLMINISQNVSVCDKNYTFGLYGYNLTDNQSVLLQMDGSNLSEYWNNRSVYYIPGTQTRTTIKEFNSSGNSVSLYFYPESCTACYDLSYNETENITVENETYAVEIVNSSMLPSIFLNLSGKGLSPSEWFENKSYTLSEQAMGLVISITPDIDYIVNENNASVISRRLCGDGYYMSNHTCTKDAYCCLPGDGCGNCEYFEPPQCGSGSEMAIIENDCNCMIGYECRQSAFCGKSTYGSCQNDTYCRTSGCSGEVCQSTGEQLLITPCVYKDCYNPTKYGLACKCISSKCTWAASTECMESDGGRNANQAGVTRKAGQTYTDHCNADGSLTENYCKSGEVKTDIIWCMDNYVCRKGACERSY